MKTNSSLLKRTILAIATLAGLFHAQGQSGSITCMPLCSQSDTSIIREWKNGFSLLYNHKGDCGSRFCIVDQGGVCVSSVLTESDVKDMEIINDTAYFCGINGSGQPIIGFFDINEVLYGPMHEHQAVVSSPVLLSITAMPRRLEVFHVSDGIHIVMIIDAIYPSNMHKRMLVEMYKPYIVSTWRCIYYYYSPYAEDNVFYCDDVAVTDNYVFVVGHKRGSAGIYMRKFEKPTCASSSSCILYDLYQSSGSINIRDDIYAFRETCFNVLGDVYGDHYVYCTHTLGDRVAITCMSAYYDPATFAMVSYGVSVKDIDVQNMLLIGDVLLSYSSDNYNSKWDVRDIRYNAKYGNLLLLHDMDNPADFTIGSAVTFLDYPSFATANSLFPNVAFYQYSMDGLNLLNKEAMISCGNLSNSSNSLTVGLEERAVNSCFTHYKFPVIQCGGGLISDFPVPVESYFVDGPIYDKLDVMDALPSIPLCFFTK